MNMRTVGLVGAGGISNVHLPAWLELGLDVVVYSLDGLAPALVERHGGGRVVDSFQELLEQCDVLDICTPTFTHRELTLEAAAAGKHIICEKPLALTADDAREMRDACEHAGVTLYPAHVVRFFPEYKILHDRVADGDLGNVAVQRFSRIGAKPVAEWFWDLESSGGIAVDQMIHDFDFARWIAGDVRSIFATRTGGVAPGDPVTVQAVLTHVNGTVSHVNGAWGNPRTEFRTRFEVAGTLGFVQHDSALNPSLTSNGIAVVDGEGFLPPTGPGESPYLTEIREFYEAFLDGSVPRVTADDGIAALELAIAANCSIETGEVITMEHCK